MLPSQSSKKLNIRRFSKAVPNAKNLGPLKLLPGKWRSRRDGWNMIALPFEQGRFNFRVLMNQYCEDLEFFFVDSGVPNRGLLDPANGPDHDQFVVTLDYEQKIRQIDADDFPISGLAGGKGLGIHHEPGLWLHMKNLTTNGIDIGRLASIPHGNSVLALGQSNRVKGMPRIPKINGLPIGRFEDLDSGSYDFETDPYLAPYKHYIDRPFKGRFSPKDMTRILRDENRGVDITRTTVLSVDTKREDAGVVNIPFAVKQAEPVNMRSTFWIQELKKKGPDGKPRLRMQYLQVVMLNFFQPREDQLPGRAQWPHVSINTLEKVYKKRK